MALKHKTIPIGTDKPGFAGVTPSLYAEEHLFSGGAHGSVLLRNTLNSDGSAWADAAAGLLLSTGAATLPTFTATIPFNITTRAIAVAVNNTYDIGASGTAFKNGYFAGTLTAGTFSGSAASLTSIPAANLTGTIASATQDLITRTGTVTSGTWSGLFGAVTGANLTNLTAANVTGSHTLPDGVLSTNVPLLNVANTFTGITQKIDGATDALFIADRNATSNKGGLQIMTNGVTDWYVGQGIYGTNSTFSIGSSSTLFMSLSTAGILTVPSAGRHIIGAGGTTNNSVIRIDGANGTGLGAYLSLAKNGTDQIFIGTVSAILGSGTSSNLALYTPSTTGIDLYTNATLRWGVNSAGDMTFGPSSHIAMSNGAPTCGTNCLSIAGTDYAMSVTGTASGHAALNINFGHTWSNAPVCTFSPGLGALTNPITDAVISINGMTIHYSANNTSEVVSVICMGY
jgi:hypothetical protein